MDHPLFLALVKVTIFTLMLAIGVNLSFEKLLSLWRRPGQLLRSLLAVVVLVPAAVALLLWAVELPIAVATGLAVLAAAPGAPLTTKRSQMAGGNIPYTASLQLTLALLAVVITPVTLGVFYGLFDLGTEKVGLVEVARQVAGVQLVPVVLGLLLQRFAPGIAKATGRPLVTLANVLFLVLVVALIVPALRIVLQIGALPIAAIIVMVIVSLAIGHLLGGSEADERSALATASIARNIGLALFIATLSGAQKLLAPTLVAYMVVGAVAAMPYALWSKRRVARLAAG